MRNTALIYHKRYLEHDAGPLHPERKERLIEVMNFFRENGILDKVKLLTPEPCTDKDLLMVHTEEHIRYIKELCEGGGGIIDADTIAKPQTYEIAKLAVGGVMLAGEEIVKGNLDNSLALVRPPGHHVTEDRAMGFCYFNNVAIMIRDVQMNLGLKRIFLLDWDAHAFNGTMEIFYEDPSVLNVSIHQDPRSFYPGTGFMEQIGKGDGKGFTVNIPVPIGTGDPDYVYILNEFVTPVVRDFRPELIVISSGIDSHISDRISGLSLTENGYGKMTGILLSLADELCSGKLVIELEGGYNLDALARSNYNIIQELLGISPGFEIKGKVRNSTIEIINSLKEILREYWRI